MVILNSGLSRLHTTEFSAIILSRTSSEYDPRAKRKETKTFMECLIQVYFSDDFLLSCAHQNKVIVMLSVRIIFTCHDTTSTESWCSSNSPQNNGVPKSI